MKMLAYYLLISVNFVLAQPPLEARRIKNTTLTVDRVVKIDEFNTIYSVIDNTLLSEGIFGSYQYSNSQLGVPTLVNAFNPLKISLFYREFNTVIILDNRLSPIKKLDFNELYPLRDISHVSVANDNDIWVFNLNTQQLELYNYLTDSTIAKTVPLEGRVMAIESNYNYSWALTSKYIYKFNYVGSLLSKTINLGFEEFIVHGENLILKKSNHLYYLPHNSNTYMKVAIPKLLIDVFFVTNESLYIYKANNLIQYQLLTD